MEYQLKPKEAAVEGGMPANFDSFFFNPFKPFMTRVDLLVGLVLEGDTLALVLAMEFV